MQILNGDLYTKNLTVFEREGGVYQLSLVAHREDVGIHAPAALGVVIVSSKLQTKFKPCFQIPVKADGHIEGLDD